MRRLLLIICALLPFHCWTQNSYTISGTVVANNTGKPLKHVNVIIIAVGNPKLRASYITGEDGRFVFSNLPRAKFSFIAERQGGMIESFHQNDQYSTAIVTGPGLNSENLIFPLTAFGSISGIATDDEGEPVRDAQVMLFHRTISLGKLRTEFHQNTQTNSSGNFLFGQLMPGTYLVAVQGRPWYAQNGFIGTAGPESATNPEFDVAYPITYYGGETDPNSASPVTLAEGGSTHVAITLHAVPAIHVQISIDDAEKNPGIGLSAAGPGGYMIPTNAQLVGMPNHLELTGIAPGGYVIHTQANGRKTVDLSGASTIDARDIPESTVSGELNFEGNEHPSGSVAVILSGDQGNWQSTVAKDGSFSINGVAAGRYDVGFLNAPGYYVKSVLIDGRPSADGLVEVTEGSSAKVSVIAANGISKIDGIALKDGAPFAGAIVLLVPKDLNRISLIRRDQSDSDGTFTLPNVLPGRYILLAIDDGRDFAYAEPGAIDAYLGGGEAIDVPVSNGREPSVKIQHRQR